MSKTFKATGINLKTQVFGESDKIVTILTQEHGLIRVIAPGARKHKSSLGGRSGVFVVNELLIAKGKSLGKITQAQTVKTYPGLAKDLGKLAASQYLAEIVLCQALSEQPQTELFHLFNEHIGRLEAISSKGTVGGYGTSSKLDSNKYKILAHLTHGLFQLLALAGVTPQINICCLSQRSLVPNFNEPEPQVGFSINGGGIVCLKTWENLHQRRKATENKRIQDSVPVQNSTSVQSPVPKVVLSNSVSRSRISSSPVPSSVTQEDSEIYKTINHTQEIPRISHRLNTRELEMLQQLSRSEIATDLTIHPVWLSIEKILRQYAQYHLGLSIRSATLIDSYFAINYDATV